MFCPKCSAYLTEKDLIKTGVKYAPGNIAIEYEAICPQCRVEMGHVSWGQLTVNPEIEAAAVAAAAVTAQKEEPAAVPNAKTCPHCGKPLPEDF